MTRVTVEPSTTGRRHRLVPSPVGPLTLVVDASDRLVGLYLDAQRHRPDDAEFGERDDTAAAEAARQLEEYFEGRRARFELDLAPRGTAFQQRVWDALAHIPSGSTTTYGELAASLGLAPGASRAVGAAVGRNPIGIVVPCHRVIGRDGTLTGYAGGLDRKRWLLEHEGALEDAAGGQPALPSTQ
ncbi:MAG TPA: methylated-DNA--[protein]-cysteine S-methyltransferase [Propionibacteriaceae bacterium]|nr:methylated-DNA--[protein]-cysteine S-methyltransferase [Propionibacteriaceae bacterium]